MQDTGRCLTALATLTLLPSHVVTFAICLRPRADLTTADRGAFDADLGWFGLVQIAGDVVARNRLGIFRFRLDGDDYGDDDNHPYRAIGDPFGYGRDRIALSADGTVVATQDLYGDDSGDVPGYATVLKRDGDDATSSSLVRHQILAHGIRDSVPELTATIGGLALSGDGTIAATSVFESNDVALFRVDVRNATPGLYPRPVELVPNARADTLLLSESGDVLIAADDSCALHSGRIFNIVPDGPAAGTARLRIYRRTSAGSRALELDAYGSSVPCQKWGYPGISVSANRDFNLVAVGTFNNESDQSATSVFEYTGSEWRLRDTITESGSRNCCGVFVSLSGDGEWLAVGSPLFRRGRQPPDAADVSADRIALKRYVNGVWVTQAAVPGSEENFNWGNGMAIDHNATIVAAGYGANSLRLYDVVEGGCGNSGEVPAYPHPDTSACEDTALTINSTSPVFHLALSGNMLAFEDSIGFNGKDTSAVRFFAIQDGWRALPVQTENFTHHRHQDVALAASGTVAAVLVKGDTDDDPDSVRMFRLHSHINETDRVGERKTAAGIFQRNPTPVWAQELGSIRGGKFDVSMRGITFNGDGTTIAVGGYTLDEQDFPQNYTVQAYMLEKDTWTLMGSSISMSSAMGQCSLSASGRVLAVGDSWFGEEREGRVRIFEFQNGEWEMKAEFVGETDPDASPHDKEEDEYLGYAMSFKGDGTLLVVGVPKGRDLYGTPEVGAVNVYRRTAADGTTWALRDRFSTGDRYDGFGCSVALSADGRRMAVGSCSNGYRSRLRLYEYDDALRWWQLIFADKGYTVTETGEGKYGIKRHAFGQSVALNEDGTLLATGSGATALNQVRVYNLSECLSPGTSNSISPTMSPPPKPISTSPTMSPAPGPIGTSPTTSPVYGPIIISPTMSPAPGPMGTSPTASPASGPISTSPALRPSTQSGSVSSLLLLICFIKRELV